MRLFTLALLLLATSALAQVALPPPPATITQPGDYYLPQAYSYREKVGRAYYVAASNVNIDGRGRAVYNPEGGDTVATGIEVAPGVTRVRIENLELRGFHCLVKSASPETWVLKVYGSSWYIGLELRGVDSLAEDCHLRDIGGTTLDPLVYNRNQGITLAGDGTTANRCTVTRVWRSSAAASESMGFNVVSGAVRLISCMASAATLLERTFGVWTNSPDTLIYNCSFVLWDYALGIPSGANVHFAGLLTSRCNH